jgi:hypothetical protein
MEAAACAKPATGYTYSRREPGKTALFQVLQQHLLTFEQEWTDQANGRTLPKFVTEELHKYMDCGILGRGFAHLFCKTCHEHHAVAFSCKGRAVCPSCLGRRMNEGALNLTDYVLPDVPLRQFRAMAREAVACLATDFAQLSATDACRIAAADSLTLKGGQILCVRNREAACPVAAAVPARIARRHRTANSVLAVLPDAAILPRLTWRAQSR